MDTALFQEREDISRFRATARAPKQVSDPDVLLALRSDEALEDDLLHREMDACIRRYVLRIPERQRDVVALHDIAGFTHREVSSALGISQSNSRVLLHRGRAGMEVDFEGIGLVRLQEPPD